MIRWCAQTDQATYYYQYHHVERVGYVFITRGDFGKTAQCVLVGRAEAVAVEVTRHPLADHRVHSRHQRGGSTSQRSGRRKPGERSNARRALVAIGPGGQNRLRQRGHTSHSMSGTLVRCQTLQSDFWQ
eukprot:5800345-Prymnesium_polylepis.1